MLVQKSGSIERRCPRRWLIAFGSGLTALAVLVTGLTIKSETAKAAIPPKNGQPAPAEKPAEVKDPLKEALEKIKKDLGDDPAAAKQVEELLKTLQQKGPAKAEATAPPPPLPAPPALPPLGQVDPAIGDLMQLELELRKQMEQALGQLRGAGFGAGFGGPGVRLRPVGPQPFPGAMSQGRLGVRVEAPNEVLTSQLNIPNGTGLVVFDVPAQSPAGKIGIMPHDILLEVAGKPVPNQVVEFVQNLKEVKETDPIDIVLLRKGKKETLKGVKLPEVKELPRPVQPRFPQVPGARVIPIPQPGAGVAVVPPPPVNVGPGESVRVEQVNDAFTVFYAKNGVKLTVSGSKNADGKAIAESIEIEDEGKTTKVESFEKLPKEYQELAKKALGSVK